METRVTQIDLNTGEHSLILKPDFGKVLDSTVINNNICLIGISDGTVKMSTYDMDNKLWNFDRDLLIKNGLKLLGESEERYAVPFSNSIVKLGLNNFIYNVSFFYSYLIS